MRSTLLTRVRPALRDVSVFGGRACPPADAHRLFAEAIDRIRRLDFDCPPNEPTPRGYYGRLLDEPSPAQREEVSRRIRYVLDVCSFGDCDPRGAAILEAGSGFGVGLVLLACLGAQKACGVEIVPWMVEHARRAAAQLPAPLAERVEPVVGTVVALPFADGQFDAVLSLEAISHYLDYRPFIAEAHRVLRPGGVLVVSDGNNGLNPWIRRSTLELWASHELDVPSAPPDKPWLFVAKRQEIAREAVSGLSDAEAHAIALRTAGFVRAEVVEAARRYVEEGVLPDSPYRRGRLSVHPDHEMVMERLFDPFTLANEIESFGFEARLRGHWAGASGRRSHRLADRVLGLLTPITIFTARGFRIAAVKR